MRIRRECRERFPRHRGSSDPDMHHGTSVPHVLWCMAGSLTSVLLWSQWRGKRSRHPRRMRKPQFYVSGKRPMGSRHFTVGWTTKRACDVYNYNIIIMGRMAFILRRWRPHVRRSLLPIICFPTGTLLEFHFIVSYKVYPQNTLYIMKSCWLVNPKK